MSPIPTLTVSTDTPFVTGATTTTTTTTEDEHSSSSLASLKRSRHTLPKIRPPLSKTRSSMGTTGSTRPKLQTVQSSDASRFMTMERFQTYHNTMRMFKKPAVSPTKADDSPTNSTQRQLTVEPAVFPEPCMFNGERGGGGSSSNNNYNSGHQSDVKSIRSVRSGSESTQSRKKRTKSRVHAGSTFISPTDIFAQNLSEAVMEADDSDDEVFVYRDNQSTLYTPSYHWVSDSTLKETGDESACRKTINKWNIARTPMASRRRPVLRSAISELPPSGGNPFYLSTKSRCHSHSHDWYPSDADEESTPLMRRKRTRRSKKSKRNTKIYVWIALSGCVLLGVISAIFIFLATPLVAVEVANINNVLGTQKQLIFDLQVKARNNNWWAIHASETAFSVFASSQYVPLLTSNNELPLPVMQDTNPQSNPIEFLGTIYRLEEPLIFQAARWLERGPLSYATSQIQIKNPGAIHNDYSGNERWSLLIRYPYELTVRGILKYRLFPLLPYMHSVHVCQMSRIDPATGKISTIAQDKQALCDESVSTRHSLNSLFGSKME
ncbi:uncharacterized protein BYT42DRAFT_575388 [Radiomyces spectabilis]|uniref:uncharacterized protein n=1 Tax=Radiomyces spectabilis TaxID=64574 RepID=UPI002220A1FC|nr:uncharacterized protein BYT42DRAFT_575388 [Radiomyces spectabilis]KAI8374190.1 hypothetical protein BYT42DRAFT_575388 [Radiomyces spectabilis]